MLYLAKLDFFSPSVFLLYRTLAMIKPDAVTKMGSIIEAILDTGFLITKAKMVQLSL